MPPKNCAACTKLVFPMEELKCLDKTWHKACFKCQVCNMTLNMKNYKGYDKLPYCNAHYPETKFTVVADTPENQRLAQNTKIQSNVKYHEEFEKAKGAYTAVAEDPEIMRVKKNMQTISNVSYHGELARKQEMENYRPNEYEPDNGPQSYQPPPPQQQQQHRPPSNYQSDPQEYLAYQAYPVNIPYDYRPPNQGPRSYSRPVVTIGSKGSDTYSSQPGAAMQQQGYSGGSAAAGGARQPAYRPPQQQPQQVLPPMGGQYGQQQRPPSYTQQQSQPQYQQQTSQGGDHPQYYSQLSTGSAGSYHQQQQGYQPPPPQQQYSRQIDSGYSSTSYQSPAPAQQAMRPQQQQARAPPSAQQSRDPYLGKGKVSKAMYDYQAADDDEVAFNEDDLIINCEPIDEGWMMGTCERTGQHGMLPSNYVERLNW